VSDEPDERLPLFADAGDHDAREPFDAAGPDGRDHPEAPVAHEADDVPPRRRRRHGGLVSCAVVLVVILGIVVGGIVLVFAGMDRVKGLFHGPPDYSGSGNGSVLVQVQQGDSSAVIGRRLKSRGVVKSVDAFTQAAADNPRSRTIQVGFYELRKRMSAKSALGVLVNPANLVQNTVTIPEGLRVIDTIKLLAQKTHIPLHMFKGPLRHPAQIPLHLPAYAKDNPEGYLFPATYAFPPNATAVDVLNAMFDRWHQEAQKTHLTERAHALGYSPAQVMTVASLVEAEANRDADRGKVARVIYNRLETNATGHLLQIDATVNYALGRKLGLGLTTQDLQVRSPYNTRKYPGLPPGPIESPGDKAIQAALHPTPGNWVYYVTVNLDTGKTKFTRSYSQFLAYKRQLQQYCDGSDRC
jgi:UPF0755 protein